MTTQHDPYRLPEGLPVPIDDGGCDYLTGLGRHPRGSRLYTTIVRGSLIEKVFYPIFPPDKDAEQVIAWLR